MTELAKNTNSSAEWSQNFTLDYAFTVIAREAYLAKENA